LRPDYAPALYLLAVVLEATPRAEGVLEKLVAVDPKNAEAHSMLAQALLRVGNTQAAIAHWRTAVELDPEDSSALYNLARTLAKMDDPEAQEYTNRFQDLEKTRQLSDKVQTLNNFALEAANAHNWLQAVEQLQESIKACGQCKQLPVLHRNLGLIYARQGNLQDGERELEIALQMDPQDNDAQKALKMLQNIPRASQ
jgi:tetratricopeptide (TPR) repeat protein